MCRLFGFVGTPDNNVTKIIRGLILAEQKSNPHGTGIVANYKGNYVIKKKGIKGLYFIARGYADFLWQQKFDYLIGHVRYKTKGEQSDRNAHPFGSQVEGKWYFLAHNGVLGIEIKDIAREKFKANIDKVEVDSEMFFRCITAQMRNGVGIVDAIKNATYEVSDVGDFAFTLLTPTELYLWRNNERPLNIFYYKNSVFYASTVEMFKKAVEISGIKMEKIKYTEVKPYNIYKIKKDKDKVHIHIVEENMPHKERKPKYQYDSYYANIPSTTSKVFGDWYYDGYSWKKVEKKKNNQKQKQDLFDSYNYNTYYDKIKEKVDKWLYINPVYLLNKELKKAITELKNIYFEYGEHIPEEEKIEIERQIMDFERELDFREQFYEDIEADCREGYNDPF